MYCSDGEVFAVEEPSRAFKECPSGRRGRRRRRSLRAGRSPPCWRLVLGSCKGEVLDLLGRGREQRCDEIAASGLLMCGCSTCLPLDSYNSSNDDTTNTCCLLCRASYSSPKSPSLIFSPLGSHPTSLSNIPPIHDPSSAIDIRRTLGGQEHNHVRHLVWLTRTSHRRLLGPRGGLEHRQGLR